MSGPSTSPMGGNGMPSPMSGGNGNQPYIPPNMQGLPQFNPALNPTTMPMGGTRYGQGWGSSPTGISGGGATYFPGKGGNGTGGAPPVNPALNPTNMPMGGNPLGSQGNAPQGFQMPPVNMGGFNPATVGSNFGSAFSGMSTPGGIGGK